MEWPVSSVAKHIAMGARGLRFNSHAGQVGYTIANGSPPLHRFFGTVFPSRYEVAEMGLATRCPLRRNAASMMKI